MVEWGGGHLDFINVFPGGGVNAPVSVTVTECKRDHSGLDMCWRAINSCHKIPESCSTWLLLTSDQPE